MTRHDASEPLSGILAGRNGTILGCLGLIVLCGLVYGQILGHEFINLDAPRFILNNPHVMGGPSANNLAWALSLDRLGYWQPLSWISLMIDAALFGPSPAAFHAHNALLHTASTILFFLFLVRATGRRGASLVAAALFAAHPFGSEAVAWSVERKAVLAQLFAMCALHAHLAYARRPSMGRMLATTCCFAAGCMAKPAILPLPGVLLLMDVWPLGRWTPPGLSRIGSSRAEPASLGRLILEKWPLYAVALGSVALSVLSEPLRDVGMQAQAMPLSLRAANAVASYATYLWKALVPVGIGLMHPFPESVPTWRVGLGAGVVLTGLVAGWLLRRRAPAVLVGWCWFLGALVPVLGLMQTGTWPEWAARFGYFPAMGLYLALAFGVADGTQGLRMASRPLPALAILLVAATTVLGARQVHFWRDSITLYTHDIEVTGGTFLMHNQLGAALSDADRHAEAAEQYAAALRAAPGFGPGHHNLGLSLLQLGRTGEAKQEFRIAARMTPDYAAPRVELAKLLLQNAPSARDAAEAEAFMREALLIAPGEPMFLFHLGRALAAQNKTDEARSAYDRAVVLRPGLFEAHYNLGNLLFRTGDMDGAARAFSHAASLRPDIAAPLYNLGVVQARQGHTGEATITMRKVLALAPNHAGAQAALQALTK